jgi:hypothetical protein
VSCAWEGAYRYAYLWAATASVLLLVVAPGAAVGMLLHFSAHIQAHSQQKLKYKQQQEQQVIVMVMVIGGYAPQLTSDHRVPTLHCSALVWSIDVSVYGGAHAASI